MKCHQKSSSLMEFRILERESTLPIVQTFPLWQEMGGLSQDILKRVKSTTVSQLSRNKLKPSLFSSCSHSSFDVICRNNNECILHHCVVMFPFLLALAYLLWKFLNLKDKMVTRTTLISVLIHFSALCCVDLINAIRTGLWSTLIDVKVRMNASRVS